MSFRKRIGRTLLFAAIGISALELGAWVVPAMPRFVSEAEAVVGRPLTPVSVAGVSRRTSRRCDSGAYNC